MIGRLNLFFFESGLLFHTQAFGPTVLLSAFFYFLLAFFHCVFVMFRGRVDELSFFDYLSRFCFLLIKFHCTFFISYKILLYFVSLLYLDWDVIGRLDLFFSVPALLLSILKPLFLLRLFHYLISFLLFPCASVWENTSA